MFVEKDCWRTLPVSILPVIGPQRVKGLLGPVEVIEDLVRGASRGRLRGYLLDEARWDGHSAMGGIIFFSAKWEEKARISGFQRGLQLTGKNEGQRCSSPILLWWGWVRFWCFRFWWQCLHDLAPAFSSSCPSPSPNCAWVRSLFISSSVREIMC